MKKSIFKKISTVVTAFVMSAGLVLSSASCGTKSTSFSAYDAEGNLVFSTAQNEITIEYGDTYKIPTNFAVNGTKKTLTSWKLLDSKGGEIKTAYGSYKFKETGKYTVEYVCDGKTYQATIVCRDSVAPEITVYDYERFGTVGDEIQVPNANASDLSGVEKIEYKVTAPSGKSTTYTDANAKFLLEEVGSYTITIVATDKNGVKAESTVTIASLEKFIDETKEDPNVIYSFDDEAYEQLVVGLENRLSSAEYSVVKSGYPEIENDTEENGVLQIAGDEVWGNVNTLFLNHEARKANEGREIVIRFALSAPTDYIKVFKDANSLTDRGLVAQMFGDEITPNEWNELHISPISFGYNLDFKDFVVQYRNTGNVTLYIDSIEFVKPTFTDKDWSETNLGDFDEEGYLEHVYQNVYCDPTTTRAFRVDGTSFEVLTESDSDIPKANESGSMQGEGAHGGVLKVTPTAQFGGITYMFPIRVDLDKTQYIRMRIYLEGDLNALIFGFFDGKGYDSTNTHWFQHSNYCFQSKQWCDYYFSSEDLRKFSTDGGIYGFYAQATITGAFNHNYKLTFYIDEIEAVQKTEIGEQDELSGMVATFEQNSLANVTQTTTNNQSEYAIVKDPLSEANNVLEVKAQTSGGVKYFLDKALFSSADKNKISAFKFKALIPEDSKIKTLSLSFGNGFTAFNAIDSWTITSDMKGSWQTFAVSGKAINAITSAKAISSIVFAVTTEDGSKQTFYLDDLFVLDYSEDTTAPTIGETDVFTAGVWKGGSLDLTTLNLPVQDDFDVAPFYEVVSVKDPDGNAVAHVNGTIAPTKEGLYKVTVRPCDAVGNKGAEKELSVKIEVDEFKSLKSGTTNEYVLADFSRRAPQSMLTSLLRWDYESKQAPAGMPRLSYDFNDGCLHFIGTNWSNSYIDYNFESSIDGSEFKNGLVAVRYDYKEEFHNDYVHLELYLVDSTGKAYYRTKATNEKSSSGVALFEFNVPENVQITAVRITGGDERVGCSIYEITLKKGETEKNGVGVSFKDSWN